jgi:quercetin dioxygenase-like cupin family protein
MDWDGNFQYKGLIGVAPLKARVIQQADADWEQDPHRQTTFPPHRFTQTIPLLYDADFRHENPTPQPKFAAFEPDLRPVLEFLASVYGPDAVSVRCILTRLSAGLRIPRHRDNGFSLSYSHRIHVPIVTSDSVFFTVGGEEIAMKEGEVWEINNMREHAVRNDGATPRIHLIVDCATPLTARQRAIRELEERALKSK